MEGLFGQAAQLPQKVADYLYGARAAKLEKLKQAEKKQLTPEEIAKKKKEAEDAAAQAEADDVGLGLVRMRTCPASGPSKS